MLHKKTTPRKRQHLGWNLLHPGCNQSINETLVKRKWTGKTHHIYTYRFVNQVPIRDGEDALAVNWCELTVTSAGGKRLYKNAFRDRGGKTLVPVNLVAWIQITRECLF